MDPALNILLVEDHDDLREATVAALSAFGHRVRGVDCAEALDDEGADFRADIFVLDLNLPGEDGLSLARRLRIVEPEVGIIMLTARDQAADVALGYDSGADIYVTKPASPEELNAAIQALARRIKPATAAAGQLTLNAQTLRLSGPAGKVDVSDNEALLLAALAKARDHRLDTWQLLEVLGKPVDELEKRALIVQIVRLRKKLEQAAGREPTIKSIRGAGYQLCLALQIQHQAG